MNIRKNSSTPICCVCTFSIKKITNLEKNRLKTAVQEQKIHQQGRLTYLDPLLMNDKTQNMLSQKLSNRRLLVDLLALMFGLGAWIGVNGIYVQLPLLVNSAPEGWSLPAHMVMLVQFANLGPILYTLYIKYVYVKNNIFTL